MRMKTLSLCAVMSALAGMPIGLAQAEPPSTRQPAHNPAMAGAVNFEKYGDFKGREVYNNAGDNIATIEDLIVDRGSGEIMHIVVKTGDILGIGGKSIAIPYSQFNWDSAQRRVEMNSTTEGLKSMAEFRPDSWAGLLTEENVKSYEPAYKQLKEEKQSWQNDPYADSAAQYPAITLDGVVRSVNRPSARSGDPAYIMLDTEREGAVKVLLGPSWFAMGYSAAPVRGDKITVRGFELPRANERTFVARTVKGDRGEVILRRNDGRAVWDNTVPSSSSDSGYIPFRYVLLSNVVGQPCDARAEDCGEVQTAIIECTSGQVAFLAIDPNENFMGIGDDLHLVPWTVARVYADGVSLDASKDMIVNSAVMPKTIGDLENGTQWQSAYKTFEVDSPSFRNDGYRDRDKMDRGDNMNDKSAWYDRADMRQIVKNGAPETVSGTVKETSTARIGNDSDKCNSVIISTPGGEREVILAPKSYASKNKLEFKKGDTVMIDAVRAVIDGQSVWIARSVTTNGKTHTLWNNDTPAWSKP